MDFSKNVAGIVDELDLEKTYDKSIIKFRFLDEISFMKKKEIIQKNITMHLDL